MKTTVYKGNVEEILDKIGDIVYEKISETDDNEEFAFYLGMLNVCASILYSDKGTVGCINLNYKDTKHDFEEALKTTNEIENKVKQLSVEDILPEIYDYIDKKLGATPKK